MNYYNKAMRMRMIELAPEMYATLNAIVNILYDDDRADLVRDLEIDELLARIEGKTAVPALNSYGNFFPEVPAMIGTK